MRLDILAKLRLLERNADELDFDLRKAITNQGRARIDIQDLSRELSSIVGVTYSKVFVNDTTAINPDVPTGAVVVAILGGDEIEIANKFAVL